ncbi:hypothetical protein HD806DRAFT_548738 [Xylariaceae sp. AK1471]|nr:hypothetical protein HD806DRAFT_548738 [Xylariaceae sp. AK1471]
MLQPIHQSIRSSCERCRSLKLKCLSPLQPSDPGAHSCVRCMRAKVECIFGRRRAQLPRNKHNKYAERSRTGQRITDVDTVHDHVPLQGTNEFSSIAEMVSCSSAWLAEVENEGCMSQQIRHEPMIETDEPSDDNALVDEGLSSPSWIGPNDLDLFGTTAYSHMPATSQRAAPGTLSSTALSVGAEETPPMPWELKNHDSLSTLSQLSALVSQVQDILHTLENGPWRNLQSLEDMRSYPIGSVLGLTHSMIVTLSSCRTARQQHYTDQSDSLPSSCDITVSSPPYELTWSDSRTPESGLAELILPTTVPEAMAHQDILEAQDYSWSPIQGGQNEVSDMPTQLLMLSCFMSLRKIYGVIFGHFENYLSLVPKLNSAGGTLAVDLTESRGLQLGELPLGYKTCFQMYKAVYMLLDAYQAVEDMMGLPESLCTSGQQLGTANKSDRQARLGSRLTTPVLPLSLINIALSGDNSAEESGEPQGVGSLPSRIQSVKALLQDKMTLEYWTITG